MSNYYRRLGITSDATDAQIRRAVRRYWQHVARYRPAREQQAFLVAATVLSNPHLRSVYDPAYQPGPDPSHLAVVYLRQSSSRLRSELHHAQRQNYKLENQIRGLHGELAHVLNFQEEMAERRRGQRRLWIRVLLMLLLPVSWGLLRLAISGDNGIAKLAGPPYQPVADGTLWLLAHHDSAQVYEPAELMPQFPGGAVGLRNFLRQQVYNRTSFAHAEQLCDTGQLSFVVDSTGRADIAQVLGVTKDDSVGQRLLTQAATHLPPLVPGYQRARPVAVRLTVTLAN